MSQKADPVSIARDLLRCRSVTPAEGGALALIENLLRSAGFRVTRMTFAEPGTAPVENLYARIGRSAPNLVFAGHTDVVPPGDEARWSHPPFAAEIADGALYGRGAVDMKGGIACALAAALDHVAAASGNPRGSISFLITGDEEGVAVNGTAKLLQWAAEQGERFDHCILGEPSSTAAVGDTIKVGRRGSLNGTLVVTGRQGHVAYPQLADNPIRLLTSLMAALMGAPLDSGSAHFEPSNLEFTSVDVGNRTVNLIPGEARARFNIRFNDCHTQASLRASIEARVQAASLHPNPPPPAGKGMGGGSTRWQIDWEPSNADVFLTAPGPFLELVTGAIRQVAGEAPKLSTTGGTSDARFIKNYCPVLELGLVGRTMHQADECTALDDLERLTAIYRLIIDRYFG
ncbi:MAG TPA: succinyl-diaminopimelate desuccinylase [Xanthobacteraceae bacterium]|nr:succinyl-diaminopimelate desuccinylase [Xanthobacteraceae bacterium]